VIDGVHGTSFAVWAPNAQRVSVVGDFNHWDGRFHPMRSLGASGVWEFLFPAWAKGRITNTKCATFTETFLKTDPYGIFL
jgi:1,4-alpha-glucan branching enzyme